MVCMKNPRCGREVPVGGRLTAFCKFLYTFVKLNGK